MQFDAHRNAGASSEYAPYLLDIQADLLADLDTRVVVPLVTMGAFGRRAGGLHPVFSIEGEQVVLATHLAAAVRRNELGLPVISFRTKRDEIIRAVDTLLAGV